jgi:hypothetical protein
MRIPGFQHTVIFILLFAGFVTCLPGKSQTLLSTLERNTTRQGPSKQKTSLKDCSCTGTGCGCSCNGPGCVCACDGGKCLCKNIQAPAVSLRSGVPVNDVVLELSKLTGDTIRAISGGDETLPWELKNTTPWQAVARLNSLPGVKLGIVTKPADAGLQSAIDSLQASVLDPSKTNPSDAVRALRDSTAAQSPQHEQVVEVHHASETEVLSLCADEVDFSTLLDALSFLTGTAFDSSASPTGKFSLRAKGNASDLKSAIEAETKVSLRALP